MARGLFLMMPAHGHVNPTIGLVNALLKKGDKITYICGEEFKNKFKDMDIKFIGFNNILNSEQSVTDIMLNMLELHLEINKLELELALKEQGEFDYVVVDPFIVPGEKLLKKFNIKKVITTTTTFALNKKVLWDMYKYMDGQNTKILQEVEKNFKNIKTKFNEVGRKFGIKFPSSPIEILAGMDSDLKIVFTSKYYQPYSENFDDTFKFVGPSIFNRHELENFNIENMNNKKVVFISLGTIANNNKKFYNDCFEALGSRKDLNVIMSIGNKVSITEFEKIPSNFRVYNYVPQLEVLKQVDLFITHGGMNSSSEALYNGVPLIVVPQFADQPLVARRITELGAGISLIGSITSKDIDNAVNKILLNNSYKKNAEEIGESLKNCGGYKEAADYIDDILK